MAEISLVAACSHSPYLFVPVEMWDEGRARRRIREDVPVDPPEVNRAKFDRCVQAFAALKGRIDEAAPDVLVVVGDDQHEQFNFNNFPAFAVCLAETFAVKDPLAWGYLPSP